MSPSTLENGADSLFMLLTDGMKIQVNTYFICSIIVDEPMTEAYLLESTFYVFLDLIGERRWKNDNILQIASAKKRWMESDFSNLNDSKLHKL